MRAEANPEYLARVAAAVQEFRDLFEQFFALHVFNEHTARGIAPAVFRRDDADPAEVARLHAAVGRASGRAAEAAGLTNTYVTVGGIGSVDPIASWQTITQPKPILEPPDILGACDRMLGRLDAILWRAEAEAPPTTGVESMHPLVWGAATPLWEDGHLRLAVATAAETLAAMVKSRTGRNDVSETALWQEALSDKPPVTGKPRLRWPGDPTHRDVRSMQDGLRQFAPGVQLTIRNPATHVLEELTPQEALERLAVLSLLAQWLDRCDIIDET